MLSRLEYCCPLQSAFYKQTHAIEPPNDTPDSHKASPFWYGALLFYYFACAFSLALTHGYWGNVLIYPLIFSYTFILFFVWKRMKRRGIYDGSKLHLNDLIRCYCHAFFGSSHLVLFIQLIFSLYISYEFDLDTDSHEYDGYFVFFSMVLQGLIEEYIGKGVILQHATHLYLPYEQYLNESYLHTYVWMGLCTGVGMSTMIDGVSAVCIIGYLYGGWTHQMVLFVIRSLIGIPFHGLLGVLWGINWCQYSVERQKQGLNEHDMHDKFSFCQWFTMWFKLGWKQALLLGIYYVIQNEFLLLPHATINRETVLIWLGVSVLLFVLLFAYVAWLFNGIQTRQHLLAVNDDEDNDD